MADTSSHAARINRAIDEALAWNRLLSANQGIDVGAREVRPEYQRALPPDRKAKPMGRAGEGMSPSIPIDDYLRLQMNSLDTLPLNFYLPGFHPAPQEPDREKRLKKEFPPGGLGWKLASADPSFVPGTKASGKQGPSLTAEDKAAIVETSSRLGIDPLDLTKVMFFESAGSMDPDKIGGTKNRYQGLIQFGPGERKAYGFKPGMTIAEQVRGPVFNFLSARGLKPGASLAQIYAKINPGGGKFVRQINALEPQATALLSGAAPATIPLPRMSPQDVAAAPPGIGMGSGSGISRDDISKALDAGFTPYAQPAASTPPDFNAPEYGNFAANAPPPAVSPPFNIGDGRQPFVAPSPGPVFSQPARPITPTPDFMDRLDASNRGFGAELAGGVGNFFDPQGTGFSIGSASRGINDLLFGAPGGGPSPADASLPPPGVKDFNPASVTFFPHPVASIPIGPDTESFIKEPGGNDVLKATRGAPDTTAPPMPPTMAYPMEMAPASMSPLSGGDARSMPIDFLGAGPTPWQKASPVTETAKAAPSAPAVSLTPAALSPVDFLGPTPWGTVSPDTQATPAAPIAADVPPATSEMVTRRQVSTGNALGDRMLNDVLGGNALDLTALKNDWEKSNPATYGVLGTQSINAYNARSAVRDYLSNHPDIAAEVKGNIDFSPMKPAEKAKMAELFGSTLPKTGKPPAVPFESATPTMFPTPRPNYTPPSPAPIQVASASPDIPLAPSPASIAPTAVPPTPAAPSYTPPPAKSAEPVFGGYNPNGTPWYTAPSVSMDNATETKSVGTQGGRPYLSIVDAAPSVTPAGGEPSLAPVADAAVDEPYIKSNKTLTVLPQAVPGYTPPAISAAPAGGATPSGASPYGGSGGGPSTGSSYGGPSGQTAAWIGNYMGSSGLSPGPYGWGYTPSTPSPYGTAWNAPNFSFNPATGTGSGGSTFAWSPDPNNPGHGTYVNSYGQPMSF